LSSRHRSRDNVENPFGRLLAIVDCAEDAKDIAKPGQDARHKESAREDDPRQWIFCAIDTDIGSQMSHIRHRGQSADKSCNREELEDYAEDARTTALGITRQFTHCH
jgi:hypothetical protein